MSHNSLDHKRRNYHYHQHDGGKDHSSDSGANNGKSAKYDDPPNSRLFIVCGKQITEEQFKEAFSKFGTIEEVWVLKDRVTAEPKRRNACANSTATIEPPMTKRCSGNVSATSASVDVQ